MSENDFNTLVLSKLDLIESRITSLESKIDEATNFADSFLGEEGFGASEGVEAIRDTFASLLSGSMSSQIDAASSSDSIEGNESMVDLVSSLRSFQERLSSVKDAISDLPEEND